MEDRQPPSIVVIAGPNGAGKSTSAPALLKGALGVTEFVNADVIAQGLSGFAPERSAVAAGRIMLRRLQQLADSRVSLAFETTLASRSFAPWIERQQSRGYRFHLAYLWLPSAELALSRVYVRVQRGGHDVPEDTVRRRYQAGLHNFFRLYKSLADSWVFYDNTQVKQPSRIAAGLEDGCVIVEQALWQQLQERYA